MSTWSVYQSRLAAKGTTKREVVLNREIAYLTRKMPNNLSYKQVLLNGEIQNIAIIDSDNLNEKMIYSMPGGDIAGGSLIQWADNHWLVSEVDANKEIQTRAKMIQCNYLLKWIDDGEIIERWCVVSDGTKYLTGETVSSYNENGMSLGDTRMSLVIGYDSHTAKLGRDNRFLIDVDGSEHILAYRITKPFKVGGVYNDKGAMSFVLVESNVLDVDNTELRIADYYKYFPKKKNHQNEHMHHDNHNGKRVWI